MGSPSVLSFTTLIAYLTYSASVALPYPMGLRPGDCGFGSAILTDSQVNSDSITSDHSIIALICSNIHALLPV